MARFDVAVFRSVCDRSRFTKIELAQIYGVTRQTIYDWSRGKYAPARLSLLESVLKTTEALSNAIAKGVLPLPESLSKEQRETRIKIIKRTVLDALKISMF